MCEMFQVPKLERTVRTRASLPSASGHVRASRGASIHSSDDSAPRGVNTHRSRMSYASVRSLSTSRRVDHAAAVGGGAPVAARTSHRSSKCPTPHARPSPRDALAPARADDATHRGAYVTIGRALARLPGHVAAARRRRRRLRGGYAAATSLARSPPRGARPHDRGRAFSRDDALVSCAGTTLTGGAGATAPPTFWMATVTYA